MADWQVLPEIPLDAPGGVCYACGSALRTVNAGTARHERALDTGHWIDFEGRLVFCESCIVQWAAALGMLPAQQAHALQGQLNRLESLLLDERSRRKNAEAAFRAIAQQVAENYGPDPSDPASWPGGAVPEWAK